MLKVLRANEFQKLSDMNFVDLEMGAVFKDQEAREERKATGRGIAVGVATLVILLAIYHAWIRKTAVLASILVPASIMLVYAAWVVFLAKRDKRRKLQMFKEAEREALREITLIAGLTNRRHSDRNKVKKCRRKSSKRDGRTSDEVLKRKSRKKKHNVKRRTHETKIYAQELLQKPRPRIPLSRRTSAP